MTMIAQRRPDGTPPEELRSGQYTRSGDRWWLVLPVPGRPLARAVDDRWTVTEYTDGTITVSPSIRDDFMGWHGYLERGVWREA